LIKLKALPERVKRGVEMGWEEEIFPPLVSGLGEGCS
jgi:hypothetical protein